MLRTSLWNAHKNLGAKFIDYCGWDMPVHYKGIVKEHLNVRNSVGIFDVSHMGFITLSGKSLFPFLNTLTTNNISSDPYKATYTVLPDSRGKCIDDVLVYHLDNNESFVVPNCSNVKNVMEHFKFYGYDYNVKITNHTNKTIMALQGPHSKDLLTEIFNDIPKPFPKNKISIQNYHGTDTIISNTGYTGEKGFEIFIDSDHGEKLWEDIFSVGEKYDILPIGLGARDTLRLEEGFALYGNELTLDITPTSTVSKWCVKNDMCLGYGYFRTDKKQIGIILNSKGMLHKDHLLYKNDSDTVGIGDGDTNRCVGKVVSGGYSPILKKSIGIALVDKDFDDDTLFVAIRDKKLECYVKKMPFV